MSMRRMPFFVCYWHTISVQEYALDLAISDKETDSLLNIFYLVVDMGILSRSDNNTYFDLLKIEKNEYDWIYKEKVLEITWIGI